MEKQSAKMIQAQNRILHHTFSFVNSMSLKCAIDLGIPDVIHKYGQPMPLSKLVSSLPIQPSKTTFIYRLMRILTHFGFFSHHQKNGLEVSYELNDTSRLLLKDCPFSMISFTQFVLDPIMVRPYHQISQWLKNDDPTSFFTEHGISFFEYTGVDPKLNDLFNDAMEDGARLFSSGMMIDKCEELFKGMDSLVDVGGGTGAIAEGIAKSFPHLQCIVFDLPHVVAGLQPSYDNLKYVGGDMLVAIPPADSILLKHVLHNWNDEECVKILKKCKEALLKSKKGKEGKIIILDMVIMENEKKENDAILVEAKLYFDLHMMAGTNGKERDEKEWGDLILSAGFDNYKITPLLGLMSLIEVNLSIGMQQFRVSGQNNNGYSN